MKRTWILVMGACALWQAFAGAAHAMIVTENTSQAHIASAVFNPSGWVAQSFTTDGMTYALSSITIQMLSDGNEGGFTLSLYDDNGGNPGTLIDVLSGPPSPNELTTYVPSTSVLLNPSTTYYAVAKSSAGVYEWRMTPSTAQTGPGSIGDTAIRTSDSGATWAAVGAFPPTYPSFVAKVSVEGVAVVPEASAALCLGVVFALAVGVGGVQRIRSAA